MKENIDKYFTICNVYLNAPVKSLKFAGHPVQGKVGNGGSTFYRVVIARRLDVHRKSRLVNREFANLKPFDGKIRMNKLADNGDTRYVRGCSVQRRFVAASNSPRRFALPDGAPIAGLNCCALRGMHA